MTTRATTQTYPTWRFILRTMQFQRGYYLVNMVVFALFMLSWLVPGWIARELFNFITGDAPAAFGFWTLIALLVGRSRGTAGSDFWPDSHQRPVYAVGDDAAA